MRPDGGMVAGMSLALARLAERVINQPLLILPEKLAVIAAVLEKRIDIDATDLREVMAEAKGIDPHGARYIGEHRPVDPDNASAGVKPYKMLGGTAIVPVIGTLVNKGSFLDAVSGLASYDKIRHQLRSAAADPAADAILMPIDSPGGEAVGAFSASDAVRAAARHKPVYAVTDGWMCSAAYAIASGATRIIATRDAMVGSIGTALLHIDQSQQLADAGIRPTMFVTGQRKADGHPFFELSTKVKGELSRFIGRVNAEFISTVSANRGIAPDKVLAQEAAVFVGADAVSEGLVDEIGDFDEFIADLAKRHPALPRPQQRPFSSAPKFHGGVR